MKYNFIAIIILAVCFMACSKEESNLPDAKPVTTSLEFIDLGLSVKWATCNVGAATPEEAGNYYAWAEVEPKKDYSWSNYRYMTAGYTNWEGITKYQAHDSQTHNTVWTRDDSYWENDTTYKVLWTYIGDNKVNLEDIDDVAYTKCSNTCRIPSKDELQELYEECTWTWETRHAGSTYESSGYKVEGPNGNSIFLPAAGVCDGTTLSYKNKSGYYWSRELCDLITKEKDTAKAYYLYFEEGEHFDMPILPGIRRMGRMVRAVME